MKTLHEIRPELTFLEYMQIRFQGIHANWHYRGDQVWFGWANREGHEEQLITFDHWHARYEIWLADGADPTRI